MILDDGKEIKGIFLYSDTARFSKSDFVVEDDCLYICKMNPPSNGLKPSENPTYFKAYPGDKVTSLEEYEDYVKSPDGKEDKYISSSVLMGILQQMYFGFGDTGLIEAFIVKTEDEAVETNISQIADKITSDLTKVLDLLIRQEDINNAYVQVDRNLEEIKYLFKALSAQDQLTEPNLILRQYTYRDEHNAGGRTSDGIYIEYRMRVQELTDYKFNQTFYRYVMGSCREDQNVWDYNQVISGWIPTTINNELLNKMTEIYDYYINDQHTQSNSNNNDNNNFNFKELLVGSGLAGSEIILGNTDVPAETSGVIKTNVEDFTTTDFIITLNLKKTYTNNTCRVFSLSVNTKDCTMDLASEEYYYLDDETLLKVMYDTTQEDQRIHLIAVHDRSSSADTNTTIFSIYYRNN